MTLSRKQIAIITGPPFFTGLFPGISLKANNPLANIAGRATIFRQIRLTA